MFRHNLAISSKDLFSNIISKYFWAPFTCRNYIKIIFLSIKLLIRVVCHKMLIARQIINKRTIEKLGRNSPTFTFVINNIKIMDNIIKNNLIMIFYTGAEIWSLFGKFGRHKFGRRFLITYRYLYFGKISDNFSPP